MRKSRRQFLEDSMIAAVAAFSVGPARRALGDEETQSTSPNERLGVAVVGVRGRGQSHLRAFAERRDTEVIYVCDPDKAIGAQRVEAVAQRQGRRPQFVADMRTVFDDKRVDIVSIATPNHWHALASIWAMQADKDVYVEKPVSHNVAEGRRMVQVTRRRGRICQTGCQIRSMKAMRDAIQYLHDGKLGEVTLGRALTFKARGSIGPVGRYDVPTHIDYNLWLGPAPRAPLTRPRFHYDWHWQWAYGNGDFGNVGIHRVDLARWGLRLNTLANSVISYGGRFGYEDAGQTPNTQVTLFDFGNKAIVSEVRNLESPQYKDARIVIFEGSEGYLLMNQYDRGVAFDTSGKAVAHFDGDFEDHFANFVAAVRSRKPQELRAEILEGHLSSGLCHLGNISHRLGRPASVKEIRGRLESVQSAENVLDTFDRTCRHLADHNIDLDRTPLHLGPLLAFDPRSETFVDSPQANELLTRQYRGPFVVPEADEI